MRWKNAPRNSFRVRSRKVPFVAIPFISIWVRRVSPYEWLPHNVNNYIYECEQQRLKSNSCMQKLSNVCEQRNFFFLLWMNLFYSCWSCSFCFRFSNFNILAGNYDFVIFCVLLIDVVLDIVSASIHVTISYAAFFRFHCNNIISHCLFSDIPVSMNFDCSFFASSHFIRITKVKSFTSNQFNK